MAIYHCSCKVMSRGAGRSAVAAAAYRSGTKITNEYDGITHDFTRKGGVVHSEVMLCENAPSHLQDRATLWNEIERVEKSSKAQLAREYEISIPVELPSEQWVDFAKNIVADLFVSRGMIADFAIHDRENEIPNPHIHVMTTMRPLDVNGKWENKSEQLYLCKNPEGEERAFTKTELALPENAEWKKQHHYSKDGNPKGKKVYLSEYEVQNNPKYKDYARIKNDWQPKTEKFGKQNPTVELWNSEAFLCTIREEVAGKINASLAALGLDERVDHRSYEEQGIDKVPTIHLGVAATAMERKGIETERGNINREIKDTNELIEAINAEIEEVELTFLEEEYIYGEIDVQALDDDFRWVQSLSGEGWCHRTELERAVVKDIKQSDRELYGLYDTSTLDRLIDQQREAARRKVPAQNQTEELIREIQESFQSLSVLEKWGFMSRQDVDETIARIFTDYSNSQRELVQAQRMLDKAPDDIKQKYQEQISSLQSQINALKVDMAELAACSKTLDRIDREMLSGRPILQPEKVGSAEKAPAPAGLGVDDPKPADVVEPVVQAAEIAEEPARPAEKPSELVKQAEEPVIDKEPVQVVEEESLLDIRNNARLLMNKFRNEYVYWKDTRKPANPVIMEAPDKLQKLRDSFEDKFKEYKEAWGAIPDVKWYSRSSEKKAAADAKAVSDKLHSQVKELYMEMIQMGVHKPQLVSFILDSDIEKARGWIDERLRTLKAKADAEAEKSRPASFPAGSESRYKAAEKAFKEYLDNIPDKHKIPVREDLEAFSQEKYGRQGKINSNFMSILDSMIDTLPKSAERLQREEEQRQEREAQRAAKETQRQYRKKDREPEH